MRRPRTQAWRNSSASTMMRISAAGCPSCCPSVGGSSASVSSSARCANGGSRSTVGVSQKKEASEPGFCSGCRNMCGGSCPIASRKAIGRPSTTVAKSRRGPMAPCRPRGAGAQEFSAAARGAERRRRAPSGTQEASTGGSEVSPPVKMKISEVVSETCHAAVFAVGFFPRCSEAAQVAGIFYGGGAARWLLPSTGWGFGRCGSWAGGLLLRRESAVSAGSLAEPGLRFWSETPYVCHSGGSATDVPARGRL